jgi:F1F0 ATPase subunit 2
MTADYWQILWGFVAGLASGTVYFGGLWLTVVRLPRNRRPYRLLLASFIGRLAVVLAGFYLLLGEGTGMLVMAMVGLLVARQLWLRSKGGGVAWTSAPMQPFSGSGQSSS